VTSCQMFQNWFPNTFGSGLSMERHGLGLFHAFAALEAEGTLEQRKMKLFIMVKSTRTNWR